MSDLDRPPATVDGPTRRRPAGSRFADLGDRLARTFGAAERTDQTDRADRADRSDRTDRTDRYLPAWDADADVEPDPDPEWQHAPARFPGARHGYDRAAVDEYVTELETELGALRAHKPTKTAVAAEIEQIGEQAAAILRVAHEQAHATTRRAQLEADKCMSDAAANALAMSDEARLKVRDLDREADMIWRERARLIEDVRNVATALFTLAEESSERFPAEAERVPVPALPATPPPTQDSLNGRAPAASNDPAPNEAG